ncbi:MAG: hypothetical protein NZ610_06055 [Candidatus Bipolaricaulota bacterium]|nr:hypothetical protein [Candidatus Bipolaricaulota bacterium]MCS7274942.1 hypothetical protein [Candidatus Bipolaricaulota bacterium]MDW8110558.1 hypothetical protein [Candidatus Bipolaricaulota bacterium]MDW8329808.1 hypothetical protein [Candidatus Bipolaricaulota bacterium]
MSLLRSVVWLLGLWAGAVSAHQTPVVIERLEISLWPEYDDPRLLVIYRGELAQEPTEPLTFAIPLTADIHAVAYLDSEGRLLKSDWQLLPSDEREQLVIFMPGSRRFQLEYYDEILGQRPQRAFTFRFRSTRYEIKELYLEVQQPLRSEEFLATPPLPENLGTDVQGLRYLGRRVGAVPVGVLVEQRISYTKRDARPSVQLHAGSGLPSLWFIAAAVALLAVGLTAVTWYWWRRRTTPTSQPISKTLGFCTGCGRAFRQDERFCPRCGRPRPTL